MRIAEVSKRYGLSADTLRYYERVGLISPVPRDHNGIRNYTEANCRNIEFIKCMRRCGISVETLEKYMRLIDEGDGTIPQRKAILEQERKKIEEQIRTMQEGLDILIDKIQNYDTKLIEYERRL